MTVDLTPARRRVELRVKLVGDDSVARFGRRPIQHEYAAAGTYSVVTWLQLGDGRTQRDRRTVTIGDTQSGG